MRNFAKIWPLLAFMVFLAGCQTVDSLNPLYTDKDVIFDPALLGKWTVEDGTLELAEYQDGEDHGYRMIFTGDEKPPLQTEVRAHLVKLQGHRFLDVQQLLPLVFEDSYVLNIKKNEAGPPILDSICACRERNIPGICEC